MTSNRKRVSPEVQMIFHAHNIIQTSKKGERCDKLGLALLEARLAKRDTRKSFLARIKFKGLTSTQKKTILLALEYKPLEDEGATFFVDPHIVAKVLGVKTASVKDFIAQLRGYINYQDPK